MPAGWWGVVPVEGRGSLPFALVHGESLVATATWALEAAGVDLIGYDAGPQWLAGLADAVAAGRGSGLVLHDPLCPLTPADFLVFAMAEAESSRAVVVGARAVTDTVKTYDGECVGETVDRTGLVQVCSPVAIPASVLAVLAKDAAGLDVSDFVGLVDRVRGSWPLRLVPAPPSARRVGRVDELPLLEAVSQPA